MNTNFITVLQSTRPKFLVLAPLTVILGIACAHAAQVVIAPHLAILCIVIALAAHASVNLLNEYADAKSGLDKTTFKTPFSGGSGALQANPNGSNYVLTAGIVCAIIVCALGLLIASQVSWHLVLFGVIGVSVIVGYTPWINRLPLLCLIAPGIGFGFLMVVGTYAVLGGENYAFAFFISLPVFCLVNNLLLLNQFPDAKADKASGRRHFVIQLGYARSANLYLLFVLIAYLSVVLLVIKGLLPWQSLISLIGLPLGLKIAMEARRFQPESLHSFLPYMGLNVAQTLLMPLVLSVSMFLWAA